MTLLIWLLFISMLILQSTLCLPLPLCAHAPPLAFFILRYSPFQGIFLCILCGCILDLFCNEPIGLHAVECALVALLLQRVRLRFLYQEPKHIALCTSLVSFVCIGLQAILLFLFDRRGLFNGKWLILDMTAASLSDALYAFVWFSAPLFAAEKLHHAWTIFWIKRKKLSRTSP